MGEVRIDVEVLGARMGSFFGVAGSDDSLFPWWNRPVESGVVGGIRDVFVLPHPVPWVGGVGDVPGIGPSPVVISAGPHPVPCLFALLASSIVSQGGLIERSGADGAAMIRSFVDD